MDRRRVVRVGLGAVAVPVGWLTAIPLIQYVALKRLRATHPELFDGAAALAAVLASIKQDTTQ